MCLFRYCFKMVAVYFKTENAVVSYFSTKYNTMKY